MYLHLLDPNEGLLVSRLTVGEVRHDIVPEIEAAIRALDGPPARTAEGLRKLHLFVVDPAAPQLDAQGRARLAETAATLSSPTDFALVTSSRIARASLTVMMFLLPPRDGRGRVAAFATAQEAMDWMEKTRQGARDALPSLLAQVEQMNLRSQQADGRNAGRASRPTL